MEDPIHGGDWYATTPVSITYWEKVFRGYMTKMVQKVFIPDERGRENGSNKQLSGATR